MLDFTAQWMPPVGTSSLTKNDPRHDIQPLLRIGMRHPAQSHELNHVQPPFAAFPTTDATEEP